VITARLVGDDAVLAWLRVTPDVAATGLARAISKLGIDLQRKIQEDEFSGQILATNIDLQIDGSGDGITATVSSASNYARTRGSFSVSTTDVRASLRRVKEAVRRPISEKRFNARPRRRRIELPERSFLRSALDEMDPAIRDEVEAALHEALTR
jgi:hypothetical protein